ncbi:MAG: tRNA (N6-isopentenyl adenosine(37)-C2)-methylthiotransferase MiaB [Aestuariivirga sp.]
MQEPLPKKAFIKTYGCQMNVYDSDRMRDVLAPLGYGEATNAEDADLVILNTCHIREKAADKVFSELGKLRDLKAERAAQGRVMEIAVAGCVGQAEGSEITRRNKAVDLVMGPQTYHKLPELLAKRRSTGLAQIETELAVDDKFKDLANNKQPLARGVAAFLTIQEGCDKFCSFCVVPYTRGAEFSRPVEQVLTEARKLADAGVREITLLGQNVNAYRGLDAAGQVSSLPQLLTKLSSIAGIVRLRYTTSHPRDMTEELIEAHATNPKLMPYLHLPVQSGSDRIVKLMNRGHTISDYLKTIEKMKKTRPDMAISGDFIVGFPGETDQDFEDTLNIVREVGYASAYSFKYSQRPGTPAADRPNQIPDAIKTERLYRLQALLNEETQKFNMACLGKTMPVLLEKPGRQKGQMIGRSPWLQSVHLNMENAVPGRLVDVQIIAVGTNSISGHYQSDSLEGDHIV